MFPDAAVGRIPQLFEKPSERLAPAMDVSNAVKLHPVALHGMEVEKQSVLE